MNFPEKLQKLRKGRGWSQEELANRITVSRAGGVKMGAWSFP